MKTLKTLVLTLAIAGTALSVNASPQHQRGLELCKAEIQDLYAEETELRLVDTRHDMSGTRMRVAARIDADNSRFVTCWLPRQENGAGSYMGQSTGLATIAGEFVKP